MEFIIVTLYNGNRRTIPLRDIKTITEIQADICKTMIHTPDAVIPVRKNFDTIIVEMQRIIESRA